MANDLQIIEGQFKALAPRMSAAIPSAANLPAERIIQSIMIACEREPKLARCTPQSLQQAAFSACALGLMVDGTSGQGYIIPYKETAQFITGYKGYTTIAGRSKFMLGGNLIYEGEKHRVMLGTGGVAQVEPNFHARNGQGKIVAAFATLESNFAPPLVDAMGLDEIMRIRNRSPGAKKPDGPWNTDFGQMAIKTIKRRLAKSCPLDILQMAAAMDDAADQGKHAYIRPDDRALLIDNEAQPLSPMQPPPAEPFNLDDTKFGLIDANGVYHDLATLDNWKHQLAKRVLPLQSPEQIDEFVRRNGTVFAEIARRHPTAVDDMRLQIAERIDQLRKGERT